MAKTTVKEEMKSDALEDLKSDVSKGELATQAVGSALAEYDYGDDAGVGLENVERDDVKMPFFTVLQSNSPQVEDGPGQMPGAKAGMFYNSVTKQLYDGKRGVLIVNAVRARNFVEYTPRNLGGGFLGAHDPKDPAIVQLIASHNKKLGRKPDDQVFGKLSTTTKHSSDGLPLDGTEFIDTRYFFSVIAPLDSDGQADLNYAFWAMLALKSTQIDKHKNVVSRSLGFKYGPKAVNPPLWSHRWLLRSTLENKKGKNFYGYDFTLFAKNEDGSEAPSVASLMRPDDPLYLRGKELHQAMTSGAVKADFSQQAAQPSEEDAGDGYQGGAGSADDEDIPM